jgi:flavin reductase (DIM6/NTAB) family NADH-FMN oxidoreductase RutF
MNTNSSSFDARDFRHALGSFGTGVTVVTTGSRDTRLVGVTANSFSSVSLEPPIVSWSLVKTSPSLEVFDRFQRFVINVLTREQIELSRRFSRPGPDKFSGLSFMEGLGGLPVFDDSAAVLECQTVERLEVGDHILFLGRVERYSYERKPTLLFCQGQYLSATESLAHH